MITYELNGMPREAARRSTNRSRPKPKTRAKADADDPLQVGAPIPGMVTALNATVGGKVAKGDKLVTLEAMKMQTTIYAHGDGVVAEVLVAGRRLGGSGRFAGKAARVSFTPPPPAPTPPTPCAAPA